MKKLYIEKNGYIYVINKNETKKLASEFYIKILLSRNDSYLLKKIISHVPYIVLESNYTLFDSINIFLKYNLLSQMNLRNYNKVPKYDIEELLLTWDGSITIRSKEDNIKVYLNNPNIGTYINCHILNYPLNISKEQNITFTMMMDIFSTWLFKPI